jgi:hypothetical protein
MLRSGSCAGRGSTKPFPKHANNDVCIFDLKSVVDPPLRSQQMQAWSRIIFPSPQLQVVVELQYAKRLVDLIHNSRHFVALWLNIARRNKDNSYVGNGFHV